MIAKPTTFDTATETAYSIGRKLCKEAIWVGDFCTWQGFDSMPGEGSSELVMRSFGPDLHNGIAGIGLFLAELNVVVQDPIVLNTLEGVMKTLLMQVKACRFAFPFGVYMGQVGVGYGLFRIGQLTDRPDWTKAGLGLFAELVDRPIPRGQVDVYSGIAGAIPIFLMLYKEGRGNKYLSLAISCCEALLDQAKRAEDHWSWQTLPDMPPLTGYAHGASGIALALLNLFESTNEEKYFSAGMKGFAFEQLHFDNWPNNWHDLHYVDGHEKQQKCTDSWSHGAPGMALARLQAHRITGNTLLLKEARQALDTTCDLVSVQLKNASTANYSLCAGLAGNADILMRASCELKEPAYAQVAHQVAKLGRMLYDHTDSDWPGIITNPTGGINKYPTPGLLTGLAGTGHFYLRLSEKPPEDVLLIT